jgi:hypothetical protein
MNQLVFNASVMGEGLPVIAFAPLEQNAWSAVKLRALNKWKRYVKIKDKFGRGTIFPPELLLLPKTIK